MPCLRNVWVLPDTRCVCVGSVYVICRRDMRDGVGVYVYVFSAMFRRVRVVVIAICVRSIEKLDALICKQKCTCQYWRMCTR